MTLYPHRELTITSKVQECCGREFAAKLGEFDYSDERNSKLQCLINESKGCAVLDTGCSKTVCGVMWLNNYVDNLSDYERETIKEENSLATVTFGDRMTAPSLKCVPIPCHLRDVSATISTDVVDCNIPLLTSKTSVKKAKNAFGLCN